MPARYDKDTKAKAGTQQVVAKELMEHRNAPSAIRSATAQEHPAI